MQEDYPTSAAHICSRCTIVSCLSFPSLFRSRVFFTCFRPCLISVLLTGPSLLEMKFHRNFSPSFYCFGRGLKPRNWTMNKMIPILQPPKLPDSSVQCHWSTPTFQNVTCQQKKPCLFPVWYSTSHFAMFTWSRHHHVWSMGSRILKHRFSSGLCLALELISLSRSTVSKSTVVLLKWGWGRFKMATYT